MKIRPHLPLDIVVGCLCIGALAVFFCMGVACGPDDNTPNCQEDRVGCSEGDDFSMVVCDTVSDLNVEIGFGESEFNAIEGEAQPKVYSGSQGGQHTFLGFRLSGATLDTSAPVDIKFSVHDGEACMDESGEKLAISVPECRLLGTRSVVLGGASPLQVDDAGVVEESSLLVFLDDTPQGPTIYAVEITDPCGAYGYALATTNR